MAGASRAAATLAALSLTLTGCASPIAGPGGLYARPMGDAPVTANPTPYSAALACLGGYARSHGLASPRIAVGRISDYTGKAEPDGGRKITQGASLMAMSALAKAGARLVERYDTSVSELELKYANNKLITDADRPTPGRPGPYRRITAGQVEGSDYYLVGGVTEFNYNIRSAGANVAGLAIGSNGSSGSLGGQIYIMNVGLDLRLVDTRTLEVVDVVSYQKQIVARQVSAGFFKIVGPATLDAGLGDGGLEPIQLGVRSVIERATLEMMSRVYGAPGPQVCLDGRRDPLAVSTGYDRPTDADRGRW